jgi:hypothetical protein
LARAIAAGDIAGNAADAVASMGKELPIRASPRKSERARNIMDLVPTGNGSEGRHMCRCAERQQVAGFGFSQINLSIAPLCVRPRIGEPGCRLDLDHPNSIPAA